jgi:hypothetical protein
MREPSRNRSPRSSEPHAQHPHEAIGRVGFTVTEAALSLGMRPDALRRLIERHARAEGDEAVARLTGGVVARKRRGLRRWLVVIPAELRG